MSDSRYLMFDASEPTISYSSGWFLHTGVEDAYNGTLSVTVTQGASVRIPFYAAQIVIVGATWAPENAPSNAGPLSLYTLDGARNTGTVFQADVANASSVTFFNSGLLDLGQHTLDITVVSVSETVPFHFDYLALGNPEPQQVPTSTAVWVTTQFVTPSSVPASAMASTPDSANASQSDSLPVAAIVGGVIGGVVLLVGGLLAFYFLYWRRRHYSYHSFSSVALFDAEKEHLSEPYPTRPGTTASRYSDTSPSLTGTPRAPEFGGPSFSTAAAAGPSSALATPHSYPPTRAPLRAPSTDSISVYSQASGRTFIIANDTASTDSLATTTTEQLTPAQRKAQEAYQRAQPEPVNYYADSGQRRSVPGASAAGGSAGRKGEELDEEEVPLVDAPPEYSER